MDIIVWERLYVILFRRVGRHLGLSGNSLKDLGEILSFLWTCEEVEYEILKLNEEEAIFYITTCPYIDAMKRNPERQHRIESICKKMCVKYLEGAVKQFNPNIEIDRSRYIGLGDNKCDFHMKLKI